MGANLTLEVGFVKLS